ncbi:hypothetical protein PAP_09025 [Palaeococcus pacificus DY20341]|uniref:Molybdopterin converting factor n=1 Tax=Palaeococcus pacificus DY20341 TaxID=1343739 RepID=A0A075LTZ4_9EURY|nr:ubiquitin-like small modifier protein 1 [Palaeococcus pacificus]AIF70185.1 hypothetical protein PAP_09025 [Palaeococcus pacificus DY20341]
MVRVKFFATLRSIAGKREVEIKGVKTVGELLEKLYAEFGEEFKNEIEERRMILVNGKNIDHLNGLDTELSDGDIVSIFPPAGGG